MANSSDSHPELLGTPAATCSARSPAALSTTAWRARLELSVAAWARQGRWLGALGRGSGWWIGDWVRYGNARYGERYGPAARVTGYDVQSLMNMAYVAGCFEVSRRRDGLSFSHHAEVAGLPAAEQDLWLDRAEAGPLSVRSLRSELRRGRQRAASREALAASRNGTSRSGAALGFEPSRGRESAASRSEPEIVCPQCGHHFTPAASRKVSDPDYQGNDSRTAAAAAPGTPFPIRAPRATAV